MSLLKKLEVVSVALDKSMLEVSQLAKGLRHLESSDAINEYDGLSLVHVHQTLSIYYGQLTGMRTLLELLISEKDIDPASFESTLTSMMVSLKMAIDDTVGKKDFCASIMERVE